MHYLYRYVCILDVFFYICIWTIVCNKEFIIIHLLRIKPIVLCVKPFVLRVKQKYYYILMYCFTRKHKCFTRKTLDK